MFQVVFTHSQTLQMKIFLHAEDACSEHKQCDQAGMFDLDKELADGVPRRI
ncbi:hypothetical protein P4S72_10645 [Vibrio sp. PP-XX7]